MLQEKNNFEFKQTIKKFHRYSVDPITRKRKDKCSVDILIPFHEQYAKVKKLLVCIVELTKSNPYLITVIDDGSPNKEFSENLKDAPQCQIIRLEKQVGFSQALSEGMKQTEQPFVCVLHSDCLIEQQNWLEELGETLFNLSGDNVQLVSARSNNPTSEIPYLKCEKNEIEKNNVISDDPLPLFCALMRRNLFEKINGFLRPYPYAWFEDEELFWRMKKFNLKQAICGSCYVHHDGAATIHSLWKKNPEIKNIMEHNRSLCLSDLKMLNHS